MFSNQKYLADKFYIWGIIWNFCPL